MYKTMKLFDTNVLIQEIQAKEKFGIKVDQMSTKAEVINIADDVTEVKVGDIVIISKWEGKELDIYRLIDEGDILMKEV